MRWVVQSSMMTSGSDRWSSSQSVSTRNSGCANPGMSVSFWKFSQFDHAVAGGGRIQKHDRRSGMTVPPRVALQLHVLGFEFGDGAFDIVNLETDMKQPGAFLVDPLRHAGLRPQTLEQFDV